jgi:hypothetical protein
MRRFILSSVAWLRAPNFPTLCGKRYDFRGKKVIDHEMCVLIVYSVLSETFLIRRGIKRNIVISVYMSPCEAPTVLLVLVNFFSDRFSEYPHTKFHENPSIGSRGAS